MKNNRKTAVRRSPAKRKSTAQRRNSQADVNSSREHDLQFRLLFEQARDVIFTLSAGGKFTSLNPSFEVFTGWSREEWIGRSFRQLIVKEDRVAVELQFNRTLMGESLPSIRIRVKTKEGENLVAEVNMSPQFENGKIVGVLGIARDMTREQHAEDMLRASEAGFRAIFNSVPVSIWVEDYSKVKKAINDLRAQGVTDFRRYLNEHRTFTRKAARMVKVVDVNAHTLKLFNAKTKDELLGSLVNYLPPKALTAFEDELIAIAESKPFFEGGIEDETLQGNPLNLWRTIVFPSAPEDFQRVLVCLTDLTERKKAEEALNLNEQRLRQIIDLVPHFIFAKDMDGKYILANQAVANAYGTNVESLIGGTDAEFSVSKKTADRFRAEDLDVIRSGKPRYSEQETIFNSDRSTRTLSTTKIPFTFSGTSAPSVLGVSVDITDRVKAEAQVRDSETRLVTVLEASPVPISLSSMENGVILYANSALADLLRAPLNELIGQEAVNYYVDPEDRVRLLAEVETRDSIREFEVCLRRMDQSPIWVSISSEKVLLEGQNCLLSAFYEITERKRAEALQSAVYQISEAANKSASLNELFRSVHATIEQVMPARNFYIALYDHANDLLSFPYYVDEVDGSASIPAAKPGRGMTEYVIRQGKPILSDAANFEELARHDEVELVGPPSPIWIGAPLVVDGRTLGVIALQDYHNPDVYTERELRMLDYVSGQVAKAIERTRLHEDVRKNNRLLTALQEATLPIISETELSEVLQSILNQATSLFDTRSGYIYLVTPDETELMVVMAIGQGKEFIGTHLKRGEDLAGKIWETGHPMNIPDYHSWGERSSKFDTAEFHAIAGVPLISGSRVIGVLGVTHIEVGRSLSDEDVELLSRFAQLASIAFENARLYTLNKQELAEKIMTEEALHEAEAKYRTVIEHISAITYTALMDERKTLLYVSPQIETLLGYSPTAYLADPEVRRNSIHPDDRERVLAEADRFYETGEPLSSDYRGVARNGRIVWFHDEAIVYEDSVTHKRYIQGIKVDITQRVQSEALQKAIYRISDAAGLSGNMDEFYRVVRESLQSVMIADNFFIALYDRAKDLLSFPYYMDEFDIPPATGPLGNGPTAYVIRRGVPLLGRSETMQQLEDEGILISAGTKSIDWLGVPLKINDATIGAMAVQTYTTGLRYSERDLELLSFVASQVAASMERKQAQEALQTSESRYRFSARATNDVIWEWTPSINEKIWSENLHPLFGYTVEEAGTQPAWWEEHIHPQDRERVFENLSFALGKQENLWEDEYRFLRSDGSYAHIIDRGYIERDTTGSVTRVIGAMSDITERKHREDELEALASVSAALRVAASRDEILQVVLDQVIKQFEARGAALMLRRAGTDELIVEAAGGGWSEYLGVKASVSGGVSRHVMESGKPYLSNDLEQDSLINLNGMGKGTGSFISVPLSTPSGMIGVLNLGRQLAFTTEDVRLVTNIADMAANAIQRASAYEQMRRQIDRIKVLRTIDMFIASGADLHLTLQTIVNQAQSHLGVDAVAVFLLNQSVHALEFSEGAGFRSPGIGQTSLRMGEGFAGTAILRREMVIVEDLALQENHPLFVQEGFVSYYGMPLIAKGDVKGVMEVLHRSRLEVDREWLEFFESLAAQAALAIDNASLFQSLQRSNMELGMAYETTLEGWSAALDLRDKETEGHTLRVTDLSLKLAEAMELGDRERVQMRRGALLHDIGKMGIPDRILLKPDVLTDDEWEIMRQHPVYAYKLLYPITHLRPALDIPYCHHEKWDGSGYPRGLKGENIPLAARIFAVADVWDALCSDRPYRPAWSREKALSYIKSLSGVHFDPRVVEVFIQLVDEA